MATCMFCKHSDPDHSEEDLLCPVMTKKKAKVVNRDGVMIETKTRIGWGICSFKSCSHPKTTTKITYIKQGGDSERVESEHCVTCGEINERAN